MWGRRVWYFLFFISLMSHLTLFFSMSLGSENTLNSFCLNLNPTFLCSGLPQGLRQQRICLECRRSRFSPWVGKIPWRRKWHSTPVSLPENSHGWRSLASYSPWVARVGPNLVIKSRKQVEFPPKQTLKQEFKCRSLIWEMTLGRTSMGKRKWNWEGKEPM